MTSPLDILLAAPGLYRMDPWGRAVMTASCRDTDDIPKVARAGEISELEGREVQIMHNGVLVDRGCYYGDWMESIISSLHGHHEPQEEKAFYEVLKTIGPGASMIELGSFWSYYSLWFQAAVVGARNICCEPDLSNLRAGQRNAELNGRNISFHRAVAGAVHGQLIEHREESDGEVVQLPVKSVDGLLEEHGWHALDLLHMDVQGAELDALWGAETSIRSGRVRYVFVSTHHYSISGSPVTHQRCIDLLTEFGGRIVCSHTVLESFSGDGLVVASFDPADDLQISVSLNHSDRSLFRSYEDDLEILCANTATGRAAASTLTT